VNLSSYPLEYLEHVAWSHPYVDLGSFKESDQQGRARVVQYLRCGCGYEVHALFTMGLVSLRQRIYLYPPGYSPVPPVADARKEWFRRFPPKTN
jgi:hypothetical protein